MSREKRLKIVELGTRIELCKREKTRLEKYLQNLKDELLNNEIERWHYDELVNTKVNSRTIPEWLDYYDDYIKKCQERIKIYSKETRKSRAKTVMFSIAGLFFIFIVMLWTLLYLTAEPKLLLAPLAEYKQNVGVSFTESGEYILNLENLGVLQSLKASGTIEGGGNVKVILINGENELLVFDSTINIEEINTILLSPEEAIEKGIDVPKIIIDKEIVVDEQTIEEETQKDKSEEEPKIEEPPTEILIREFDLVCEETCDLSELEGFDNDEYTLRIEISENAKLNFASITYGIVEEIPKEEIPPIEEIEKVEEKIKEGKRIRVSNLLDKQNVLINIDIPESWNIKDSSKLRVYWREKDIFVDFNAIDFDENSKIDRVEWQVPISNNGNETFDIIVITKAEHLDSNRSFISDIYDEVKELDGVWSETIPSEDFVRVTFEQNLSSENDITVYPRVISGNPRIEVYEINGNEIIATFENLIENEYNQVLLTSLIGEQDTFDLRILDGDLEFEHIVDPTFSTSGVRTIHATPLSENTFVVAWCDASENDVTFSTFYADGTVISSPAQVDVDTAAGSCINRDSQVSVSAFDETRFAVTWFKRSPTTVLFSIYNIDGSLVFGPVTVDGTAGGGYTTSVSTLDPETVVVAWFDAFDTTERDITFSIYNIAGSLIIGPIDADDDVGSSANAVSVSAISNTAFVIAWYDNVDNEISFRIYDRDGNPITGIIDVDNVGGSTSGGDAVSVSAISNTAFVIGWYDQPEGLVEAQVFSSNGVPLGGIIPVDTTAGTTSYSVSVSALNENAFAVGWRDVSSAATKFAVYDVNGNIITPETSVGAGIASGTQEVTSRATATGIELCEDNLVIAWAQSATQADWAAYHMDGTIWDGVCPLVNTPPTITVGSIVVDSDEFVELIGGGTQSVSVVFTAEDLDGPSDLVGSTASATFTKTGEAVRSSVPGSCIGGVPAGNQITYTCNVDMEYFDADGTWDVSVYIEDQATTSAQGIDIFTVNLLQEIILTGAPITFGTITPGTQTNAPAVSVINLGNYEGTIKITANDLSGPQTLAANGFYAAESNVINICTNGNQLQDSASVEILSTNLLKDTFPGEGMSEDIVICLNAPNGLAVGSYTATGVDQWTISILASMLAIRRKRKKKKIEDDKLVRALNLMTDELKEKYKLSEQEMIELLGLKEKDNIPVTIFSKKLGGLEALCKYLKENLGMNYHKIAQELNRDDRTIWTAYKKACEKKKEKIKVRKEDLSIPFEIFKDRRFTILESIIAYLRNKGMKFKEIASLLERDSRNIQTIYSRAVKKIGRKV